MIRKICCGAILFLFNLLFFIIFNYTALSFIIDNNIKNIVCIYGLGMLLGFITIISYHVLNELFFKKE